VEWITGSSYWPTPGARRHGTVDPADTAAFVAGTFVHFIAGLRHFIDHPLKALLPLLRMPVRRIPFADDSMPIFFKHIALPHSLNILLLIGLCPFVRLGELAAKASSGFLKSTPLPVTHGIHAAATEFVERTQFSNKSALRAFLIAHHRSFA
jgi:hypothetical protein